MKKAMIPTRLTTLTGALALAVALTSTAAAETFKIDPAKSKVAFSILNKAPGAKKAEPVPGSFGKFAGTLVIDPAAPAKCSVEMEIETASIDTGNQKRDDHLRNQDFFKVKEHPKMSFKSKAVKKKDDGTYEVAGTFTLLGEAKPLTITFKPTGESGGTTTFQIKRSDYGMDYRVPDTADEVDVTLTIVGTK